MSLINEDTLNKLFASLDDLDNAINNAKKILIVIAQKKVANATVQRLIIKTANVPATKVKNANVQNVTANATK